jgi:hypothetical protein
MLNNFHDFLKNFIEKLNGKLQRTFMDFFRIFEILKLFSKRVQNGF